MNSKENVIGVKKAGNLYGAPMKPYTRIKVNYLYRNESHVRLFDVGCSILSISSITLGKSTSKIICTLLP